MSIPRKFTSESVTEGHPDKMADKISDGILDALIAKDTNSRVACETLVTTGMTIVAGEITTSAYAHIPRIVRSTIREIGYNDPKLGFDWESCSVMTSIDEQSLDISQGVTEREGREQGAGDQGMMFGYATRETEALMPAPIHYAHRLTERMTEVRKKGMVDYFGPDGKSQVTFVYDDDRKPIAVDTVVLAQQHREKVSQAKIQEDLIELVIKEIFPSELLDPLPTLHINGTGSFVIGGPHADCGLTGRKIIVDTYGGMGRHGGGAFSGKDPSKVDRSGSYAARWVAKNVVAAGMADVCEVEMAYCIGVAEPVSLNINTHGTATTDEDKIISTIKKDFDLRPKAIIQELDLLRPIYQKTAAYGHFGREDPEFTWEKIGYS